MSGKVKSISRTAVVGQTISWFLGISMFMVGALKFVNPFKGWYTLQVEKSGLGDFSYVMGILGEIAVGIILVFALLQKDKLSIKVFNQLVVAASVVIVIMMATGMYVHFHPEVPAEVLPLKIKPPYIPGMFLLLALGNIYLTKRQISYLKPN